jgi:hypothetical protein
MSPPREWPRPADLMLHHEAMVDALVLLQRAGFAGRLSPKSQFIGMTLPEFDQRLRELREELDREVSMALVASCEALLRVDFRDRVERKLKEPRAVRARFKEIADRDGDRVRLEDILAVWKDHVGAPDRFAAFQEYVQIRHWLAHGRWWSLKSARRVAPEQLCAVIRDLFSMLPGFPKV